MSDRDSWTGQSFPLSTGTTSSGTGTSSSGTASPASVGSWADPANDLLDDSPRWDDKINPIWQEDAPTTWGAGSDIAPMGSGSDIAPTDSFSQLVPSTMTTRVILRAKITTAAVFFYLPTTRVPFSQPRESSIITLHHEPHMAGRILRLNFEHMVRGQKVHKAAGPISLIDGPVIIKPKKSKKKKGKPTGRSEASMDGNALAGPTSFENSVHLYIASPAKVLAVKISNAETGVANFSFTGAQSTADVWAAARLLLDNLFHLEKVIRYVQANPMAARSTIDWFLYHTRGQVVQRDIIHDGFIVDRIWAFSTQEPLVLPPCNFDSTLVSLCWSLIKDYPYYSVYENIIKSIFFIPVVIRTDTTIIGYEYLPLDALDSYHPFFYAMEDMINLNFHLDFKVDKHRLANIIYEMRTQTDPNYLPYGFLCAYINPKVTPNPKIEYPYECNLPVRKPPKEPRNHTFRIHCSGSIQQTSVGEAYFPEGTIVVAQNRARDVHYLFLRLIYQLRPQIETFATPVEKAVVTTDWGW